MTRLDFVNAINTLKQQDEIDDSFHTHMGLAFPDSYAPIYKNVLWELSIQLLELAMNDDGEWISWWVFETEFGKRKDFVEHVYVDEKQYCLYTAGDLYDFLTMLNKRKQTEQ